MLDALRNESHAVPDHEDAGRYRDTLTGVESAHARSKNYAYQN